LKLFISADIEGVTGIVNWDETTLGNPQNKYFCEQMTREVGAACEAALEAGADEVLVKDAHGSARSINPAALPEKVRIVRGWAKNPYIMMAGLDESFDGVFLMGYHSSAGMNGNPLAHTMDTNNVYVKINGEFASELMINTYAAALFDVPVVFVSGDRMLCEHAKTLNENISTAAVSEGIGNASISVHPDLSLKMIKSKVQEVLKKDLSLCKVKLPESFNIEIRYKEHFDAYKNSFYPGARQIDTHTVVFETKDYFEVLRFILFVL
jgi:D-amino peptidase